MNDRISALEKKVLDLTFMDSYESTYGKGIQQLESNIGRDRSVYESAFMTYNKK